MRALYPLTTGAILLCATALHAQTVLIPDPGMRLWYETYHPGVVDVDGYLDTTNPDLASVTSITISNMDWLGITQVSGLEFFPNATRMELLMGWNTCTAFTLDAWPPALASLLVDSCSMAQMPALPGTLTDFSVRAGWNTTLPIPLPPTLTSFTLVEAPALAALPALPTSLRMLSVESAAVLTALGDLPVDLEVLDVLSAPALQGIPVLPPTLEHLNLATCASLTSLDAIPATVTFLGLGHLPALDVLPACPPGVRTLGASAWMVDVWGAFPDSLRDLFVTHDWMYAYNNGDPYPGFCLPLLPIFTQGVFLNTYPIVPTVEMCLPNQPPLLMPWNATVRVGMEGNEDIVMGLELCVQPDADCLGQSSMLEGLRFTDTDGNGLLDAGEQPAPYGLVAVEPGGILAASNDMGEFALFPPPGNYTVTAFPLPYHSVTTPLQAASVAPGTVDSLDAIGTQPQPGMHDVVVWVHCNPAKPGFDNQCWCALANIGTEVGSGSVQFDVDADQSWVESSIAPTTLNGNTAIWTVPLIPPATAVVAAITLHTDAGVVLGTPIDHVLTFTGPNADLTPLNNTSLWSADVVGSFDPNDKQVAPTNLTTEQVLAGDKLTYTVRFQNTGTYPAERVVIIDTLSNDLQWASIGDVVASHDQSWYIEQGVLHAVFDNINLPDSTTDLAASQGFFRFSMRPNTALTAGQQVLNNAGIYFDFNAPIITSTAVCTVTGPDAIEEVSTALLVLAPTPADDLLFVHGPAAANARYEVVDASGRGWLQGNTPATGIWPLHVSALPGGLYALRIRVDGKVLTGRFVKR